MLIKLTKHSATYATQPLSDEVYYRVIGVGTPLVGESVSGEAIILNVTENKEGFSLSTAFIPFDTAVIIDDSPEEDWVGGLLTERIYSPTAVIGCSDLMDVDRYVRLHDLNETEDDAYTMYNQYLKYGKNIPINPELLDIHSDDTYKLSIHYLNSLPDNFSQSFSIQDVKLYESNMKTVLSGIETERLYAPTERSQEILADKLISYCWPIYLIKRRDSNLLSSWLQDLELPSIIEEEVRDAFYGNFKKRRFTFQQ